MKPNKNSVFWLFTIMMLLLTSACGGGESDDAIMVDDGPPDAMDPVDPTDPTDPTNPALFNDFWYGYYFENPLTNPEDPTPGFVYLQIPEAGAFEGEMYFSFVGCDDTFDVGRVTGNANGTNLAGTWSGTVDGTAVGGDYIGELNMAGDLYEGTYTNAIGKVEIECTQDDSIFVAPDGTWFLGKGDENAALNIMVDAAANPLTASWDAPAGTFIYLYVVVDAACLEENLDLETCLMWSGNTQNSSFIYGEGSEVPAKPLIAGSTYLLSVAAVSDTSELVASSNLLFEF